MKQKVQEWSKEHPDKRSAYRKRWVDKNKDEVSEKRKKRAEENPEHIKDLRKKHARTAALKRRGLTRISFAKKLSDQGYVCALCEAVINETTCCIDHDHKTGKTRDLLCHVCNTALGHFEKGDFAKRALAYIVRHRSDS